MLHVACRAGKDCKAVKTVEWLLGQGASPTAKDDNGLSPLDFLVGELEGAPGRRWKKESSAYKKSKVARLILDAMGYKPEPVSKPSKEPAASLDAASPKEGTRRQRPS